MGIISATTYNYNGYDINKINQPCWRFVHDGTNYFMHPFYSSGCTQSLDTVFAADTEQECLDEINNLGLSGLT